MPNTKPAKFTEQMNVRVEPDDGEITITGDKAITFPEPSEWECHLFGSGSSGFVWMPSKGEVPNRFWRWMQYLCFGNRWVKK